MPVLNHGERPNIAQGGRRGIQDTDLRRARNNTEYFTFGAMRRVSLAAGSHTITMTGKSASGTMYMRRARLTLIPLAGITNWYVESEPESTSASTAFQTKTTLTINVPTQGDCIVLNTNRIEESSTSYYTNTCLNIDAVAQSAGALRPVNTTDYATVGVGKVINLAAGSHTITSTYDSSSASGTAKIKNARILVIHTPLNTYPPNLGNTGNIVIRGVNGVVTNGSFELPVVSGFQYTNPTGWPPA